MIPHHFPSSTRRSPDALHTTGSDRSGRVGREPGLHELRRAGARHPPVDAGRGREPRAHPAGARRRDQLLRHRQRLLRRHAARRSSAGRCATSPTATRSSSPPRCTARCGRGPNGGGLSRKAILSEIDHSLRRLGTDYVDLYQIHRWDHADADRGDPRGAARRGQGRQGPLHRRVLDVRLAVREGAVHRRPARLDPLRLDAEPLQPALPRGGARDAAALRRPGHRRHPVEPAGPRPAHPALGRRPPPAPRPTSSAARCTATTTSDHRRAGRRRGGRARGVARRPRSRWPGCSATRR